MRLHNTIHSVYNSRYSEGLHFSAFILIYILVDTVSPPSLSSRKARKYLPFGFGPGNKTEILECGEIDDDEEDYGDYQVISGCG